MQSFWSIFQKTFLEMLPHMCILLPKCSFSRNRATYSQLPVKYYENKYSFHQTNKLDS